MQKLLSILLPIIMIGCSKPSLPNNPNNPPIVSDSSKTELSFNYNGTFWNCKGHKIVPFRGVDSGNGCVYDRVMIYNNLIHGYDTYYQYILHSNAESQSSDYIQFLIALKDRINPPVTLGFPPTSSLQSGAAFANNEVDIFINNVAYGAGIQPRSYATITIQPIDSMYRLWNYGGLAISGTFEGKFLNSTSTDSIIVTNGTFTEIPMDFN